MKHLSSLSLSLLFHSVVLIIGVLWYRLYYTHTVQPQKHPSENTRYVCIQTARFLQKQDQPGIPSSAVHEKVLTKQRPKQRPQNQKTVATPAKRSLPNRRKKEAKRQTVKQKPIQKKESIQKTLQTKHEKKILTARQETLPKTPQRPVAPRPKPQQVDQTVPMRHKNAQATRKPLRAPKNYAKTYLEENIAKIRSLIQENIYYPRKARKRRIEGEVVLRFAITPQGVIENVEVLSSAHPVLTYAAKQVLIMIEDEIPKPKETIRISVPFRYTLR